MNKVDFIKEHGLIVILRGVGNDKLIKTLTAVYNGGGRIAEITFDPSDSDTVKKTCELIKTAKTALPDMLIGAGTVTKKEYIKPAKRAGADFIVSPDTDVDVIRFTKKCRLISIPGAMTPTECKTAVKNGADIVKLFPATADKVPYIINIMRPLSDIPFMCFGGTNLDTIVPLISSGAFGVGTGLSIIVPELVKTENYEKISELTRLHLEKIAEARKEYR